MHLSEVQTHGVCWEQPVHWLNSCVYLCSFVHKVVWILTFAPIDLYCNLASSGYNLCEFDN